MQCLLAFLTVTTVAKADDSAEVLVFGGTGRLGAPIVRLLVEADYPVTVFARPTSDRGRLAGLELAYLVGDLMDADSVVAALKGQSVGLVIDASARGLGGDPFYVAAMRNILAGVAASPVKQFILHGSVGAGENMQQFPEVGFERIRDVMIAKGEAEDLLKASGIPYTIIRNGLVKPDGTPATGSARLIEDDRVLGVATRLDLAAPTLQCLENRDCLNKTFHAVDDSF